MKVNELRVGNIVFVDTYTELEGVPMRIESISYNALCKEYYSMVVRHIKDRFNFAYYPLLHIMKPIPLTEELLLRCGFKRIQHFTVKNSLILDIGRGRELSIGDVENCNQMMYVYKRDGDAITDIVCLHNYDYDGWLYLHQLQNLYFTITGEELKVEL